MEHELTIRYGDDVLVGLGLSPAEFSREASFLLASKLYDLGRLTSGQAAKLCGRGRVDFLLNLDRIGVPASNLRPEEVDADVAFGLNG